MDTINKGDPLTNRNVHIKIHICIDIPKHSNTMKFVGKETKAFL